MNSHSLKLCTYNVNGFKTRQPMIERLMAEASMDVLMLQETLLLREERIYAGYNFELLKRGQDDLAARGSAVLIRKSIDYTLVCKEITSAYELMAIRISPLTLFGFYIRINHAIPQLILRALQKIQ